MAAGSLLFAVKGVLVKLLYARGMNWDSVVVGRAALALPLYWLIAMRVRAWPRLRGARWQALAMAAAAGLLCYCLGALLDFYALSLIDAGLERALLFSYPAMVVIATAAIERRWPLPGVVASVLLTWAGVALAVGLVGRGLQGGDLAGGSIVLLCAATFAAYFMISERYVRELGAIPFTAVSMSSATLGLLAWQAGRSPPFVPPADAATWLLLLAVAALALVLPALLIAEGVRRIGAQRAALVSTVGPPFTILVAWATLGERMSALQLAGVALILGGIIVLELLRRRPVPPPPD